MARKDSVKKLKEELLSRRKAIRLALDGDYSLLRQIQQESSGDFIDCAVDATNDEISSQLAQLESHELTRIEIALRKIEDGTYGKCDACNRNIPLGRLQALPYATLCIDCQRQQEQSSSSFPVTGDWQRLSDQPSMDDFRLTDIDFNIS